MAGRRTRAPGGGRRPKGEYSGLAAPLSIRMPPDMRAALESAAKRSGRSLSQELLARLNSSFARDRDKARDPAMRALNFLFSSLAYSVHWNTPGWRTDPFLFRAIKLGIGKLLDALEPKGEARLPRFWEATAEMLRKERAATAFDKRFRDAVLSAVRSPETMAGYAADRTMAALSTPRAPAPAFKNMSDTDPFAKEVLEAVGKHQEDEFYGMINAQRDLRMMEQSP